MLVTGTSNKPLGLLGHSVLVGQYHLEIPKKKTTTTLICMAFLANVIFTQFTLNVLILAIPPIISLFIISLFHYYTTVSNKDQQGLGCASSKTCKDTHLLATHFLNITW